MVPVQLRKSNQGNHGSQSFEETANECDERELKKSFLEAGPALIESINARSSKRQKLHKMASPLIRPRAGSFSCLKSIAAAGFPIRIHVSRSRITHLKKMSLPNLAAEQGQIGGW